MRKYVIIIAMLLSGCATVAHDAGDGVGRVAGTAGEIGSSVPAAIGTVVGTAIFGGTLSTPVDPSWYLQESVNTEFRIFLNKQRRKTAAEIAKQFD